MSEVAKTRWHRFFTSASSLLMALCTFFLFRLVSQFEEVARDVNSIKVQQSEIVEHNKNSDKILDIITGTTQKNHDENISQQTEIDQDNLRLLKIEFRLKL